MSTTVITPQQIQQATVRITCGDEYGSGFFISKTLLLTARHVIIEAIEDKKPIIIFLADDTSNQSPIQCTLLGEGGENLDIALLEITPQSPAFLLPLSSNPIRYNAPWETFGFPFAHQISGNRYQGSVLKTNKEKSYDIELKSDIKDDVDYRGLSGSALVMNNEVAGIFIYSTVEGFGAISIHRAADFLDSFSIPYRVPKRPEDLPDNFKDEIEFSVTNQATITLLESRLDTGGKYYLLHGSPGSGKTTICATFNLNDPKRIIAGRYFLRLPNDQRALSYRVSREAFLEWIEDLISQKLSGSAYPQKSVSLEDRIKNVQQLLLALNEYYQKRNELGFIVIDGLDELADFGANKLVEFLGLLPEVLPDRISFLLSIIRKGTLPPLIQASIESTEEIKVVPLEIDECAFYLQERLGSEERKINFTLLLQIAEKSEGHPLYLRYLIEQVKNHRPPEIEPWIQGLPRIEGNIAKYYERIWLTDFTSDDEKLWIAVIVSQLRQPVSTDVLLQMLPENVQQAYLSKFSAIRHLFKVNGTTSIYHSSFGLFVEKKAKAYLTIAHDHINDFCYKHTENVYSITNIIHHTLSSSDPLPSITRCNQAWADACAIISVQPELVLGDIEKVEIFCLDKGDLPGFIRIKLLLQRIRFRYDNVLAMYASSIARFLLAAGNPADALKYIVRFSTLLVSNEEALFFLRKFNEIGAKSEAQKLLRAIKGRYQAIFEKAKLTDLVPLRAVELMAKTIILDGINKPNTALKAIPRILKELKDFSKMLEDEGKDKDEIETLRMNITTFYRSSTIYNSNHYTKSAAVFKEKMPNAPEAEFAGIIANTAINLEQLIDHKRSPDSVQMNKEIAEDLEFAIDNYGYLKKDSNFIYAALLEDSNRSDIILKLISELYTTAPQENLRMKNGVDVDTDAVHKIINFYEGKGYEDEKSIYPVQNAWSDEHWEQVLISRIKLIGFCFGKAWRFRAEKRVTGLKEVINQVSKLLASFGFFLKHRTGWKRSYTIPEEIFPILYDKVTRFYMEFDPDNLKKFVGHILVRADDQLGLYTEGYRGVLSSIVWRLSYQTHTGLLIVQLLKNLEEHVLIATQNRWECVPALLDIAEMYAKFGNTTKAQNVYQQMLDTSMGPTWYKEDQFSLINTALESGISSPSGLLFQEFSKQLEFAAGELTFQRYVRVEQQEFIGNIARHGNVAAAINYYQYQTIPDPVQVIINAERYPVDMIAPGEGYILGAGNINEASAILSLLQNVDTDPLVRWAFTEVFYINDDIYRYIRSYVMLQVECLNKVSATLNSDELSFLRERLKTCVLNEAMNSNRHHYLEDLRKEMPQNEYEYLVSSLKGADIQFPEPRKPLTKRKPEQDEGVDKISLPGMGKSSNLSKLPDILADAQKQIEMDNKPAASGILADGLLLLHRGEADIWMGSALSEDVGKLWEQLSATASTEEILKLLKEPITERHTHDWRVVEKLLWILKLHLNSDQVEDILEIVREHIHLIIQEPEVLTGFNWKYFDVADQPPIDQQLLNLLIWLLDHPYISLKKRVIEVLFQICEYRPFVITTLLNRSLSEDHSIVKEACVSILYRLSKEKASLLCESVEFNSEIQDKILQEKHFMIKYYFFKIAENLKTKVVSMEDLFENLLMSFPQDVTPGADVDFEDHPYMTTIEPIITAFTKLNMLNGAFCKTFFDKINELSQPLNIDAQFRSGRYLERSYYDEEVHYKRGIHILRQAFNLTITFRVTRGNLETCALILKNSFLYEN